MTDPAFVPRRGIPEPKRRRSDAPRLVGKRGLVALLLSAALVTCTDHPTGPARGGLGYLAIRPVVTTPVALASFGLTIDNLRVLVTRPVNVTVFDKTFSFDPDSATLRLALPIPLQAPA